MKRGSVALGLGSTVMGLGLYTLAVSSSNHALAADLDDLHHEVEHLLLQNTRVRAMVEGHVPGRFGDTDELRLEGEGVSE